jgi:predicted oxidoreductase (fatty acid repression mutant protein)
MDYNTLHNICFKEAYGVMMHFTNKEDPRSDQSQSRAYLNAMPQCGR